MCKVLLIGKFLKQTKWKNCPDYLMLRFKFFIGKVFQMFLTYANQKVLIICSRIFCCFIHLGKFIDCLLLDKKLPFYTTEEPIRQLFETQSTSIGIQSSLWKFGYYKNEIIKNE